MRSAASSQPTPLRNLSPMPAEERVLKYAIAGISSGSFPSLVVLDHSLDEAKPRRVLFGRGCLRENPAVGKLQQRVARLERLEEDGPAARREGAKARCQHTFGLEDVMQ